MKILLTGSGFLSKHLFNHINNRFNEITVISRTYTDIPCRTYIVDDLQSSEYLEPIFNFGQFDIIYHLAACSYPSASNNEADFINANIIGTYNLLKACKKLNQPPRFIHSSSIVVYGPTSHLLERPSEDTVVPIPPNMYAISKLTAEYIVDYYTNKQIISGVNLRFPAIIGPSMTHGAIKDIINKVKSQSDKLELMSNSCKPYLYIADFLSAIEFFSNNRKPTDSWNICPNNEVSIDRIANIIMDKLNIHKEIKWGETFHGDVSHLCADNTAAHLIGWTPQFTSEEAIIKTIDDICSV